MRQKTSKKLLEKIQNDYNFIAEEFDQTRQNNWEEFELFLEYIKNGDNLADLGCGNGRLYAFIKQHRKINYTGIDISKNLIEKAKKAHPEVQFMLGDLLSLPLGNENFDTVTAIASLHHIPSNKLRKKALQEMHRILKKDGILILTNWNLFQPKYKKYIWKSRFRSILTLGKYNSRDTFIPWRKSGINRYYYAFTENELKGLLDATGFEIITARTKNNFLFICQKK